MNYKSRSLTNLFFICTAKSSRSLSNNSLFTFKTASLFFLVNEQLPIIIALIGLVMVLKSFTERTHARMAWILVIMNHFYIALAISFNEHYAFTETLLYLSGISLAGVLGFVGLRRLKGLEGSIDLDQFHRNGSGG